MRAIPTVGRSILDFFVLQPGVNAPPISSGGSGTGTPRTVYGGLGLRQMNVDGVSNNLQGGARNLVISQEAVQEFQTVTNFSAEFGRVAGGIQNAFTRSGINRCMARRIMFTRQDWLAERPFLLAPDAPEPDFERYNYGATVGGPLVRDRRSSSSATSAGRRTCRWSRPSPRQNAAAARHSGVEHRRLHLDVPRPHADRAQRHAALAEPPPLVPLQLLLRPRIAAERRPASRARCRRASTRTRTRTRRSWCRCCGPNLVNEARFLYADRSIENGVAADPDAPNIDISGIGSFNGNANGTRRTRERGVHIVDNLTWTKGRHALKVGLDLLPVTFRERTTNINGSFVFGGLAAVAGVRGAVTPLDQFLLTEQRRHRPGDRPARTPTRASRSRSAPSTSRHRRSIRATSSRTTSA